MPPIRHQETPRGGTSGNRLLVKPGAAPAILLWMQGETRRGSLPGEGPSETGIVSRAALLFAFILCGGLALACMLPPLTDAGMPQTAIKMQNPEEIEAEERRTLRLAATRAGAFDRGRDLPQSSTDKPVITVLQEPLIDTALSSLSPAAEHTEAPKTEPILPEPRFAQEFWRTMGHSRLADAYAAYLGRYSWKIAVERNDTDLDLGQLERIDAEEMKRLDARRRAERHHISQLERVDAEEMKRLDARRRAERLHISLSDVPIPRRAPRTQSIRKTGAAKTARKSCRNRIWRCTLPIAPMAQGSAQSFRSRHN